jgi:hypothetical protein
VQETRECKQADRGADAMLMQLNSICARARASCLPCEHSLQGGVAGPINGP